MQTPDANPGEHYLFAIQLLIICKSTNDVCMRNLVAEITISDSDDSSNEAVGEQKKGVCSEICISKFEYVIIC